MEQEIKEKSLNRRKKLIENREERMRKILFNFKEVASKSYEPSQSFETKLKGDCFDSVDELKKENEVTNDMFENSKESLTNENLKWEPLIDTSGFANSNPSNRFSKSNSIFLYTLLLTLTTQINLIVPVIILILSALIGSFFETNFFTPFVISQLIRGVFIIIHKSQVKIRANILTIVYSFLNHLIIFITLYILFNAIKMRL